MRGGIIVARRDEGQALEGVHPGLSGKECAKGRKRGTWVAVFGKRARKGAEVWV